MATWLALAVSVLLVLAVLARHVGTRGSGRDSGSWTVCVYLCGSNLESRQSWGTKTLEEIRTSDVPASTTVVIQAGGSKKWHADEVAANGARLVWNQHELESVGDAGEVSMGDASTLADFLAFCERKYPADHTAVILWDHGGGPLKGACYDETRNYDALTLAELDEALASGLESRGGRPYDVVGFDACLMGSLETAVMLADRAQWLVASEEIEAGAGWDYDALFQALRSSSEAPDVAAAICDGYLAKCATRGKDAAATLSVIDLSKIDEVERALCTAIEELEGARGSGVQALRHLVFGTRYAEFFGGSTDEEGRSNLVDLKGMAEGNVEGAPNDGASWKVLTQAVDEAVVHRVCGSTTSGANGISLWYPQTFDAEDLAAYAKVSPLSPYAQALERLYEGSMGTVGFSDAGSVTDEGRLSVTIDPATSDEFFDLYVVNRAEDSSYQDTNVDIADDWDNLTFSYNPATAVAITLDGMVLDATLIAYERDYQLFSAPIVVDGEDANLRIAWMWDDADPEGGHYELLGVWNGIDHVTGVADRSTDGLRPGSTVGALSLRTGDVRQEVVVGNEVEIADQPLAPGRYECRFVALDLRGNEYASDICSYEVDANGNTKLTAIGDRQL